MMLNNTKDVPPLIAPNRNISTDGWQWLSIGLIAIFAFVAFVVAVQHTTESFNVGGIALDDTDASLHGTFTFLCSSQRIQYLLQFSVPEAETVTALRLEYMSVVGPDPPEPVPLCQNTMLDPVNPYGGPPCPSQAPCVGSTCYQGTLSAAGQNSLLIEHKQCKQLRDAPTLIYLRLYTDMHPDGIVVASVTRHSTT